MPKSPNRRRLPVGARSVSQPLRHVCPASPSGAEPDHRERTRREIGARVMGHHRPVSAFNIGMQGNSPNACSSSSRADDSH
ncbi:hypothetical protein EXE55_18815 [Burkholderia glumae]|nr:hypothetical protein EXE55_18815 [Burkholderia glumae]